MTGFSVSLIVTVKLHVPMFPLASLAVQVTVVAPTTNVLPLAGAQVILVTAQLSVAVGAVQVTLAFEHTPASALAVMFPGQVTTGFCVSLIVTVKLHCELFPAVSVAVQVTVWLPTEKVLPLAGTHPTVTPGQLSVAVAAKVTLALPHWPASAEATMAAGHVTTGFSLSLIVTVKLQVAMLPLASVAVQVTVWTPTAKVLPLAGKHATVAPAQLSVTVGAT